MKRTFASLLALLMLPTALASQAPRCEKLLCAPSFLLQPGIAVFNAVGAPTVNAAGDRAESTTEILARVATVIPTGLPRVSLMAVVWWTPFMTTQVVNAGGARVDFANNAPNLLVGSSLLLARHGPAAVQFAVADGYRRWERPGADGKIDSYRHNLMLIPSLTVRLGGAFGAEAPPLLRSLSAYAIWQQQVTNMPRNVGSDGRPTDDRAYPPGLFFGLTVPLAPSP